jgi:DNA-binding beta-propeller fold protein YncE
MNLAAIRSFAAVLAAAAVPLLLAGCASTESSSRATRAAEPAGANTYAFWPQFPVDPHIQFVRAFTGSGDLSDAKPSALEQVVFGKEVAREAMINKPYGVAIKGGRIYVCDIRAGSLVVLDLVKKQTRLVGTSGANRLSNPAAVAVADDGTIYVAESERGAVIVFDTRERYSHSIGFAKFKPSALAIHGDRLYACDMAGQTVQVFDRASGKHLGSIGSVGDGDGQFRLPLGVATDAMGNIYVSDMMRCRVQKFAPDGSFLAGVGTVGDVPGSFVRPKHIAVDSDGVVYVVDAAFQNVQMFDDQLRLLMFFGAAGPFPGAMNLPAGIAVSDADLGLFKDRVHPGFEAKRLVVVTNQFGDAKVSVYAMGELRQGYTAADLAKSSVPITAGLGTTEDTREMQKLGQMPEPVPKSNTPAGTDPGNINPK